MGLAGSFRFQLAVALVDISNTRWYRHIEYTALDISTDIVPFDHGIVRCQVCHEVDSAIPVQCTGNLHDGAVLREPGNNVVVSGLVAHKLQEQMAIPVKHSAANRCLLDTKQYTGTGDGLSLRLHHQEKPTRTALWAHVGVGLIGLTIRSLCRVLSGETMV